MSKRLMAAAAALLLATGAGLAADLPMRAAPPPPMPVPVFVWTGFNFGTLSGYAWSDRQTVRTTGNNGGSEAAVVAGVRPRFFALPTDDFTNFGGGLGYDYQFTPGNGIVVGVAADATWTALERRRINVGTGGVISGFEQSLDWLGTVRGRVGYGFDRFLIYATGGLGYGNVFYRGIFLAGGPGTVVSSTGRSDRVDTGYVVGGGAEYAIPADSFLNSFSVLGLLGFKYDALTVKAEYLRYDLGTRNVRIGPVIAGAGDYNSRFRTEGNIFRGGLTYRFGGL